MIQHQVAAFVAGIYPTGPDRYPALGVQLNGVVVPPPVVETQPVQTVEPERVTCPFCGETKILIYFGRLFPHYDTRVDARCGASGESVEEAVKMAVEHETLRLRAHP